MKKLLIAVFGVLLISSCAHSFKPIYTAKPDVNSLPEYSIVVNRIAPKSERKVLNFEVFEEAIPDENNFFNNPGAYKRADGSAPSVIISVPREAEKDNARNHNLDSENNLADVFSTDGYFNEAEQLIEAALLRQGFNVLDRSKFEAKLRDLRDKGNSNSLRWRNDDDLTHDDGYRTLKNVLDKKYRDNLITEKEYIIELEKIKHASLDGMIGKNRKEDEMNDIAEVIRAAQNGKDNADYLLQINRVSVSDAGNKTISINNYEEVKDFLKENSGLMVGNYDNTKLPSSIKSKWLHVEFNAKLIDIKTGSIVWLGAHEIESSAAEHIKVSINVEKNTNNASEINTRITIYNNNISSLDRQLEENNERLNSVYHKASSKTTKLENKEELIKYTTNIEQEIKELELKDKYLRSELQKLLNNVPEAINKEWEYSYKVNEPVTTPNLIADGKRDVSGKQRLIRHRRELIKKVTSQLIETIIIKEQDTVVAKKE